MSPSFNKFVSFSALAAFLLAGCQKPADQPATSSGNAATSSGSNSAPVATNQDAASDSRNTPPSAANGGERSGNETPARSSIVIPSGTAIEVVLDQSLSSKTSSTGQSFSATVVDPVEIDGQVLISKGAHARGTVTNAKAAGRFKGASELGLALRSVEIDGKRYEVRASTPELSRKGKGKRTAAMAGGGAGGGALIGGLAGGGKGALIGGLIGAGAGTGGAAFTGNRDVTLPAETGLTFRLVKPLEITR